MKPDETKNGGNKNKIVRVDYPHILIGYGKLTIEIRGVVVVAILAVICLGWLSLMIRLGDTAN